MKMKKTHRPGALLLAMMMLFTTLPVTALAEAPETEMPGVEENVNAVPATDETSESAGNEDNGGLDISDSIVPTPVGGFDPTVGREIYIRVFHLGNGVDYNDFATANNIAGCEIDLYDEEKHLVQTSQQAYHSFFGHMCKLTGVKPGDYTLKITVAPEEYDTSREYRLRVDNEGNARLEIYQKDGQYHMAKYIGMAETLGSTGIYDGVKSPVAVCLGKKSPAKKLILTEQGEKEKFIVGKNDIVEYKITKTIYGDHNTVVEYGQYVNIGAKVDQSFTDVLSPNLELTGPIQVKLDGQDTQEFVASYDENNRTVTVSDQTQVKVVPIDFNTPTKLPKDQALEVTFKVKVLKAENTIVNTVDDSTTELIPFTVKVEKLWDDQENQAGKRPASVKVQLKADGEVIKTVEVTAQSDWKYTFTDLRKKNDEGKEIVYTVEELPVEGYKTSIVGDVQNGFTVTNKFLPPPPTPRIEDVSIPVEKVWEDDGNRENLRPTSVTVRLYADGKDTGKSVVLTEANGWKGRFDALPKYDAGRRIMYTVKEERVAHYDSSVSGDQTDGFTVTNRVEEPPKPPIPPTPPTPPIPPTILVPRIPRAGVGA